MTENADTHQDPSQGRPGTGWRQRTLRSGSMSIPAQGLSAAKAAELLEENGPNALPAEATMPGWKQFLAQYRSYMQIILVVAAVASILIGESPRASPSWRSRR